MDYLNEYTGMQNCSSKLSEQYQKLYDTVSKLKDTVLNMQIPWEGEANKAYVIRLRMDFTEAEKILEHVASAVTVLSEATDAYQKTEHMVGQLIGGIRL